MIRTFLLNFIAIYKGRDSGATELCVLNILLQMSKITRQKSVLF